MNTETKSAMIPALVGVAGVIILAASLFLFVHKNNERVKNFEYINNEKVKSFEYISDQPTSITYTCRDGSFFTIQLPMTGELHVVDGVGAKERDIFSIPGRERSFQNAFYTFMFSSYEVYIGKKMTNTTVLCSQASTPNAVRVNLDLKSKGGAEAKISSMVSESIIGKWQDVKDPTFTREFKANGVAIDDFGNGQTASYTWSLVTKENLMNVPFPVESNTPYLQMDDPRTIISKFYLKISKITPEELQLIYMGDGNVADFRKM